MDKREISNEQTASDQAVAEQAATEQAEIEPSDLQEANNATPLSKLMKYSKLMGPAWVAIALNIGGATIAAAVVVGSSTGFKFLWALVPEVFTIWIACILCTKLTLATGEGTIGAVRKFLGEGAALFTGICVFMVNAIFHAVNFLLAGMALETLFGVDQRLGSLVGLVFILLIVFNPAKGDRYIKIIETTLRISIWLLFLTFLLVLFMIDIPWGELFKGLFVPTLPNSSEEMATFAGLLGAAIAVNVPVMAAYGIKERKWGKRRSGLSIFEITFTHIMLLLVQLVVVIATASTLFQEGTVVTDGIVAAQALEPFAGGFAVYLFGIGLLASVFTTLVSQVLLSGYLITDTMKWKVDTKSTKFKLSQLAVVILGVTAPLFGWNAFQGVIYASAVNLTFMPVGIILWWLIGNKTNVMNELKLSKPMNISVALGLILVLIATIRFWINL
ncbi:NRAMP family divalent metal transporter [Alteribacillus sp. YIM 98480]|uniref:NRAMP family divalent metal transporter n=1 Tax=Alteribacillus sp. YIM 98480 TaxID=2606599 RepID=UPI00131CBA16|nr:divalent metal cation transporter [Alteribacillus sp. YIM 98480]